MRKEIADIWSKALRSGAFKQQTGALARVYKDEYWQVL